VEAATNQAVCAIFPRPDLADTQFLFFALMHRRDDLLTARYGGAQPNISQTLVRSLEIALPPLPEQKAIAYVLRTLQQAKEATANVSAAARRLKASLMRHLFTYGPVAMAEADQVEFKEVEEDVFFPADWESTTVGDVAELQYGYRTSIPKTPPPNGVRIISTAEITNEGLLDLSKLRTVEVPQHLVERYTVHRNDILFNWRNAQEHVGKTALVEEEYSHPTIFASFIIRIVAGPKVNHRFLHFLISHLRQEKIFFKQSRRAVNQANFNANELAAVKIALPPSKLQTQLADWLAALDQQVKVVRAKQTALDEVFTTLLHELMTGTRRVHAIVNASQRKKPKRATLGEILGKWPGDEADEQVRKPHWEVD
jgi:type I restriction enzyme S subunit